MQFVAYLVQSAINSVLFGERFVFHFYLQIRE